MRVPLDYLVVLPTGGFLLSGLGFFCAGLLTHSRSFQTVGFWLGVAGMAVALLPLGLGLIVIAIEKLRR